MRAHFVGREQELREFDALVRRSSDASRPVTLLMVGSPGSGKSRLVQEFAQRAHGLRILRVTGYEPERAVPLAAARELLTELSTVPKYGRRLRAATFGDAGGRGGGPSLQLFESAYRCLHELAPVVLLVDDLQWADALSVGMISYLIRASEGDGHALVVVVASRPGPPYGALSEAARGMLRDDRRVVEIELPPLAKDDGIALVRGIAPHLSGSEAARIWEVASGSPFWMELLAIDGEDASQTITRRFAGLGDDAAAMLQTIALIGRPSDVTELTNVLMWPTRRSWAAIGELRSRGLVAEVAGNVEAAHDLIRESARRGVPEAHRRRLHARISRHLWRTGDRDVGRLREALDHSLASGDSALDIALALADAPQRRLIGSDGVHELARIAAGAAPSDPLRRGLELRLAELASELGDRVVELERWEAVAEVTHETTRARALIAAAKAAYRIGRRDTSSELVRRARAISTADTAVAIGLDALESQILRWLDHRLPQARAFTHQALEAARRVFEEAECNGRLLPPPLRLACLDALHAACDLALQEGNERDQAALAEQIVQLADGEMDRMEAQLLLASAYRRSGRMDEAEQLARRVRDQAQQRLYPALVVTAGHHLARALYSLARMDEAEAVAHESEQLSARIGETGRFLSEIRSLRPGIALGRGNWRAGIKRLRDELQQEADPHYQLGIHQEVALWLSRLEGSAARRDVRRHLAAARECLAAVGCPRCGRELALRSAEALARVGDVEAAVQASRPEASARGRQSMEARHFLAQAIAAMRLARGDYAGAARSLARLGERLQQAGLHREALWADLDRGAALAAVDTHAAVAVYRSVMARAAAGGVLTDLELARHRLRELGVRVGSPVTGRQALGLSRRELQVAALAATGASNPEIATTLFISRKTVERHLTAAFAKVGARNRTELAATLATQSQQPSARKMGEMPDGRTPSTARSSV